jgi:pilus assembly protein Flp/PilA
MALAGIVKSVPCLAASEIQVSKTNFHRDENGQDLVEYGLLAALIALAMVAALQTLSGTIGTIWTTITNRLAN